jgi:hypothetical protein
MKMEQTECFETSAYKIQTPANYPEENIQQLFTLLIYLSPMIPSFLIDPPPPNKFGAVRYITDN